MVCWTASYLIRCWHVNTQKEICSSFVANLFCCLVLWDFWERKKRQACNTGVRLHKFSSKGCGSGSFLIVDFDEDDMLGSYVHLIKMSWVFSFGGNKGRDWSCSTSVLSAAFEIAQVYLLCSDVWEYLHIGTMWYKGYRKNSVGGKTYWEPACQMSV